MRSFLDNFPTEDLVLHKENGKDQTVKGLVDKNLITTDNISANIEEGGYIHKNPS